MGKLTPEDWASKVKEMGAEWNASAETNALWLEQLGLELRGDAQVKAYLVKNGFDGSKYDQTPDSVILDLVRQFAIGRLRKKRKERGSSEKTIRRNVEICDKHDKNPKLWTGAKLAGHYELSKSFINDKVLKHAPKWRKLQAEIDQKATN